MKKENPITIHSIRSIVEPRISSWWEASFALGLLVTLAAVGTGIAGQQVFGLEAKIQDTKLILVPLALVSASLLGYALTTRRMMLFEIQALKGYANGFKAMFDEKEQLKDAYLELVKILALSLRGQASSSPTKAEITLYQAFGAQAANSGNGGPPKFLRSYNIIISQKLRATPQAISIAMFVFLAIMVATTFIPNGTEWNWWDIGLQVALLYAFSTIFFVSGNMLRVFGTRGSQYRVSEFIEDLLEGIEEDAEK